MKDETFSHRKSVYAMVEKLANSQGDQTIPNEDVIDLAWAVKILMETVFPIDTLVTLVHESEQPKK